MADAAHIAALFEEEDVPPPVPVSSVGAETEDDEVERLSGARASFSATDWTVETIVEQMRKNRLDLSPKFQRRAAWNDRIKSRFIESAMLSYPIPQLVLAEKRDQPGQFLVIDGKQRLLALRQFYAGLDDQRDDEFTALTLSGLDIVEAVNGFDIKELQDQRADLFDAFENHTIRTVVIRNWELDDFLHTLFLRLNTGSVSLSPQELRQALVPGPFVDFADERSGVSKGLQLLLGNTEPDRRMVDAELLVRFTGFQSGTVKYAGNLKGFLDSVCSELNDTWSEKQEVVGSIVDSMDAAIDAAVQIFSPEYACHKWSGKWERSFNRAVFDVQIGAFSSEPARLEAIAKKDEIVSAFKALCTDDSDFIAAISTTTKSLTATQTRFSKWYEAVSEITKVSLEVPPALRD